VVCGINKPRFTNVFDFLIGGEKKDATQKKIKIFQFAQKHYPKNTHTHTQTNPSRN
jgi:hypothetical protein